MKNKYSTLLEQFKNQIHFFCISKSLKRGKFDTNNTKIPDADFCWLSTGTLLKSVEVKLV